MRYQDELILEAAAQDRDDLVELISETTDIEVLEAVEEELFQEGDKLGAAVAAIKGLPGKGKSALKEFGHQTKVSADTLGLLLTSGKEIRRAEKNTTIPNTGKYKNITRDSVLHSKADQLGKEIDTDRIDTLLKAGSIVAGVSLLAASAGVIIAKHKKIADAIDDKAMKIKIASLEKKLDALKKDAKDGKITPIKAMSEQRVIKKQLKDLEKEAKAKIKAAAKAAEVEESADTDSIRLAIYESCANGEIDEDQRDELLSMLD